MSKTNPTVFDKSSTPPPPLAPPFCPSIDTPPRRWCESFTTKGARECDFTTVRFVLEGRGSARDTLAIEIDAHNGAPSSQLIIRGQFEAAEIPAHLRWLAEAIARQAGDKRSAIRERVTFELRGGGR
jgi:hypothetical protein